ncbi:MAG: hypothetical protein A4E66_02395 [Syntrophus sp. PtaB.Bin001]|nr:MAG: hypothetical protein A4E66_02395 [Syntrophus sp. PtaB.Bin001]
MVIKFFCETRIAADQIIGHYAADNCGDIKQSEFCNPDQASAPHSTKEYVSKNEEDAHYGGSERTDVEHGGQECDCRKSLADDIQENADRRENTGNRTDIAAVSPN